MKLIVLLLLATVNPAYSGVDSESEFCGQTYWLEYHYKDPVVGKTIYQFSFDAECREVEMEYVGNYDSDGQLIPNEDVFKKKIFSQGENDRQKWIVDSLLIYVNADGDLEVAYHAKLIDQTSVLGTLKSERPEYLTPD